MDNLTDKISELLSSPGALDQIREMAESMLGDRPPAPEPPASNNLSLPDIDIGRMMSVLSKLKTGGNDDRSRLLLALKPHLSPHRRQKVDKAVKILQLLDMLPLLKETGIF